LIVHIRHDDLSEMAEPFKINGTAELYIKKNNQWNYFRREFVIDTTVKLDFETPQVVDGYYLKLQIDDKFNRFNLIKDSIPIETNFGRIKNIYDPKIELIYNIYTINAPEQVTKIQFDDISEFGKCRSDSVINNGSIRLLNGEYRYVLIYEGGDKKSDIIIINNSKSDNVIYLPSKSREVRFIVPRGNLVINDNGLLGKINIKNGQSIMLLDNTDYEYILSEKYYITQTGILSLKDTNSNGEIIKSLAESNRGIAMVMFLPIMPDGKSVIGDININGKYCGITENPLSLKFGYYPNIRITYTDSLSSRNNKFIYVASFSLDITQNQIKKSCKLELN
jgi:hypothetical protein